MTAAPPPRIDAIDGLRAVAVIAVIVFHIGWPLPGGLAGVDIFFVISGFVVTRSIAWHDGTGGRVRLATFYARRLRRIVPALAATLVATTLAYCLFVPLAWLSDAVQRTAQAAFIGAANIALGAHADTYFAPIATLNPFTQTWSLGVEEQFYLILPALLIATAAVGRRGRNFAAIAVALLSATSFAAGLHWSRSDPTFAFYAIGARGWELGIGVLLSLTEPLWRPAAARMRPGAAVTLSTAGAAAIVATLLMAPGPNFPFPGAALGDLGTAAVIAVAVAGLGTPIVRLFATKAATAVGRASYSLYLWHWPVIVLMRWTSGVDTLPLQLGALVAAAALGWASWHWIEQPTQRGTWMRAGTAGQQIARGLLLLGVAFALSETAFLLKPHLSLSRTADRAVWYPASGDAPASANPRHPVTVEHINIGGGTVARFRPAAPNGRTIFVIGDSHALPYMAAMRRFAEDRGVGVVVYSGPGCPFLPLHTPMREQPSCDPGFYAKALHEIVATGRAGDVLFLPGLRLPRFVDQWGVVPGWGYHPDIRARATAEAIALLRPVSKAGIRILFEGPTPVFRIVPLRCSDAFNRNNPVCRAGFTVPRAVLDRLRAIPLAQMRAVATALPGVEIFDAFTPLCPGATCSAVRNGKPVFVDGDHLSGHGATLIYPALRAAIFGDARH